MAKTFAGARLRRLREDRGISQAELARQLGISPSYLNQIEHDSRPLTVPVLLRITEVFGVDTGVLRAARHPPAGRRPARGAADHGRPSPTCTALATKLPEVAEAVIDAVPPLPAGRRAAGRDRRRPRADRRPQPARAGDATSSTAGRTTSPASTRPPRGWPAEIGIRRGETPGLLRDRLADRHGVRIVQESADALGRRPAPLPPRHPHAAPVDVAAPGQQAIRMAAQIALLEYADLIDEIIEEEEFDDVQTQMLTRVGLANYFAAALILPYGSFLDDRRADAVRHRAADRPLRRWAGRPSATG